MPPFRFRYSGRVVTVTPGTIVFHWNDAWYFRAYDEDAGRISVFYLSQVRDLGTA